MKTSAKQNVLCYNFYVCDRITEIEDFEIIMKRSRKRNIIIEGILVIFAFIAALLLLSAHWAFSNWSSLTVEEIYFQLTAPLAGTGNNMIAKYVLSAVVPAAVIAAGLIVVLFFLRKRNLQRKVILPGIVVCAAVTLTAGAYAWVELDFTSFLVNHGKDSTYIEDNYADPSKVDVRFPQKKRNLIYIYLESMEMTYADRKNGGGFDFNAIPELTELAEDNEDFSGRDKTLNGGIAMTGATWTVGAMFAQTSGLPLKIPLDTNGMSSQEKFFPGIRTLGDILDDAGYQQYLMMGSSASFGGRDTYFTEHGNYEMLDYTYARQNGLIPYNYHVWWGYEDQKLFAFAKDKLSSLGKSTQPFNFTMLTVDTHFPDGYVCSLCDDEFEGNQYANVMHCSSRQVTEFIKWCQQQPWYSNTTIVISGDHPTMDADFCDDVAKDYQRKVYTVYINADAKPADPDKTRLYSTFDDFPTTLAALGCTIDGNRLGLGTNLFSDVPTLTERDGLDEENVELMRNSQFMNKASGISRQVIETRRAIRKMKPKIKASNEGEFKHFEITGLQDLTKFGMEIRYAYLQIRGSDQLILYSPKLERQPDGTYTANVRLQRFDGYDTITAMVRIKTQNGTVDLTDNVKFKTD